MKTRIHHRGFTLIELLVIVGIIAIMMALLIPALASASLKSQRTVCLNQVRQQCLALTLFANGNSGNLPNNSGFGFWAWDTKASTQTAMTNNGTSKYTWFDPGVEPRFNQTDFAALWTYEGPVGGLIGYCQTLAGTASFTDNSGWMYSTNINTKLNATTVTDAAGGGTFPVHPSSRPLMACANMQMQGNSTIPAIEDTYDWLHNAGGYLKEHLSAHMLNPSKGLPAGGNEGMLDGHVVWVPFSQMQPRCGTGGNPYFYY